MGTNLDSLAILTPSVFSTLPEFLTNAFSSENTSPSSALASAATRRSVSLERIVPPRLIGFLARSSATTLAGAGGACLIFSSSMIRLTVLVCLGLLVRIIHSFIACQET